MDPVSALMEYAAAQHVTATFPDPFRSGLSHQPRFLCQWQFGNTLYPAVFAMSKKLGKKQSAEIALEFLGQLNPIAKQREYVIVKAREIARTRVDKSTIGGIDRGIFVIEADSEQVNSEQRVGDMATRSAAYNSVPEESQDCRLDPTYQQRPDCPPRPRLPRPLLGALAETQPDKDSHKKMQAFDQSTMEALQRRSTLPHTPPRTLPRTLPHVVDVEPPLPQATGDQNSLDITATLVSLKTEYSSIHEPVYQRMDAIDASRAAAGSPLTVGDVPSAVRVTTPMNVDACQNPISVLHELGQKRNITPEFRVLSQTGPSHQPIFVCRCVFGDYDAVVSAPSKDKGKQEAFALVLAKMNQTDPLENIRSDVAAVENNSGAGLPEKNPISALMELGTKLGIAARFECSRTCTVPVSRFSGVCVFGNKRFGPVEYTSKQEVKTAVFKLALDSLVQDPSTNTELTRLKHNIISPSNSGPALNAAAGDSSLMNLEVAQNILSQRNPISAFLEHAQAHKLVHEFVEVDVSGEPHCRRFTYKCTLDGKSFPEAVARTKKEAKRHAADLAIKTIFGVPSTENNGMFENSTKQAISGSTSSTSINHLEPMSKCDKIAQAVLTAFTTQKTNCGADLGKVVLASFVVENVRTEALTVVSLGTGSKCIGGKHLSMSGTEVNDCHAEVIARRGLLRFIYAQIEKLGENRQSIFDLAKDGGKLTLKPNIRLHLYISTAPCGDGAIFTHNDRGADLSSYSLDDEHFPTIDMSSHGQLRSKVEDGEGTIPTKDLETIQTFDGILGGGRLRTMSCSDKICKWNVLGVQGTLLNTIIQPLYIESLVLGQLFHPGHLSRALCCRVKAFREYLSTIDTSEFKINHIKIGCMSSPLPRSTTKSKPISLNWMKNDSDCELLDAEQGQVIAVTDHAASLGQQLVSRVSRRNLYSRYLRVAHSQSAELSYHDAKMAAADYVAAKEALYDKFFSLKYGTWIRKPAEPNMFKLQSREVTRTQAEDTDSL